jgi:hypothetical protein
MKSHWLNNNHPLLHRHPKPAPKAEVMPPHHHHHPNPKIHLSAQNT